MMTQTLSQVDLAFVVDTTGSMGAFIDAARREMTDMLKVAGVIIRCEIEPAAR
jgi:hypothetical protein